MSVGTNSSLMGTHAYSCKAWMLAVTHHSMSAQMMAWVVMLQEMQTFRKWLSRGRRMNHPAHQARWNALYASYMKMQVALWGDMPLNSSNIDHYAINEVLSIDWCDVQLMNGVCSEALPSRSDEQLVVQQAIASRILVKQVIIWPHIWHLRVSWKEVCSD